MRMSAVSFTVWWEKLTGSPDNPMRQVIVSIHSPAVVRQVSDDSLLIAELKEAVRDRRVCFNWLPDTWRAVEV